MKCPHCKCEYDNDSVRYESKTSACGRLFFTEKGRKVIADEWKEDDEHTEEIDFFCRSCDKRVPNPLTE